MHSDTPEMQHINQSVNQKQIEIDRLCDIADHLLP